jgi:short-subunit dehydrogenase
VRDLHARRVRDRRVTELLKQYGPWAVIAGGSEGVGEAFARELAQAGVHLVLVARTASALDRVATSLRREYDGVEIVTASIDLAATDAAAQVAAAVADRQVGLLVLNAGANTLSGTFMEQDPEDVARAVRLSVHLPLQLVHHFAPAMIDRQHGGILMVGSLASYLGQPGLAVYSADKAWQRYFCESLWLELRPHGIDVLHLVLGVTRTPAMERAGLAFDAPGLVVSDPGDVARQGLAELAAGPVKVIAGNEGIVESRSGTDRARLIASTAKRMSGLLPRSPAAR